jgi:hypothetical protein
VFFECSKCHLPYFGGARECGAPAAGGAPGAWQQWASSTCC